MRRVIMWVRALPLITMFLFALFVTGVVLVGAAHFWPENSYGEQVFLHIGGALTVALPVLWLDSRYRRSQEALRRSQEAVRATIESVEGKVESVEGKVAQVGADLRAARESLADLGRTTQEQIAERRVNDRNAAQEIRRDVSEPKVLSLLRRGQRLGALDPAGVRVRLPGTDMRIRFASATTHGLDGGISLSAERPDGDQLGDSAEWTPGESAATALVALAEDLQAAGGYPGDASFDATALFERLARTLEVVLARRTGAEPGSRLGPVVELADDWAITRRGLEHINEPGLVVPTVELLDSPEAARRRVSEGGQGLDPRIVAEALEVAAVFHRGEARRDARKRVPRVGR